MKNKLEIKAHVERDAKPGEEWHMHLKHHLATVTIQGEEENIAMCGRRMVFTHGKETRTVDLGDLYRFVMNAKVKPSDKDCAICGLRLFKDGN